MAKAPPLQVNNAVMLRLLGSLNTTTVMINVLAAIKTGTVVVDQTLANQLDTAIRSAWTTNMAPRCATTTSFGGVGVRDLSQANLTEFFSPYSATPGTGTGDSLPGGAACVVSLKTAFSGRRYRGRVYLGGFTETENLANGVMSATVQTACAAFIQAIDTALQAHTMRLAVLSRPAYAQTLTHTTTASDGTQNVVTHNRPARPGAITQVSSISVRNTIWDSQRKRNGAGSGSTLFWRTDVNLPLRAA